MQHIINLLYFFTFSFYCSSSSKGWTIWDSIELVLRQSRLCHVFIHRPKSRSFRAAARAGILNHQTFRMGSSSERLLTWPNQRSLLSIKTSSGGTTPHLLAIWVLTTRSNKDTHLKRFFEILKKPTSLCSVFDATLLSIFGEHYLMKLFKLYQSMTLRSWSERTGR